MTGGYVFIGVCPSTLVGGGVPHPRFPGLDGGVPHSQVRTGGTPSQVWDGGCTLSQVRTGGYPFPDLNKGGTPPTPSIRQSSIASNCYAAGGMPLAFTQEDFLVLLCFVFNRK